MNRATRPLEAGWNDACQALFDLASDPMVRLDSSGRVLAWNSRAEEVLGWRADEAVGQTLVDLVYPIGARSILTDGWAPPPVSQPSLALWPVKKVELRHRHGRTWWSDLMARPVWLEGTFTWLLRFSGLPERLATAHHLRVADAAFDCLEGMVVTDARHVIVKVNEAFSRITGYGPLQAVGKTSSLFRPEATGDAVHHEMRSTLAVSGFWQGEVWDRRQSGERYPAWLRVNAVTDDDGTVQHHVIAFIDNTRQHQSDERIRRLAFHDPLTQLPNRRLMMDRLRRARFRSDRQNLPAAVLVMDLDHFKDINDSLGHQVGDDILQRMASRLEGCLQADDTLARIGGDEFVVILEGLPGDLASATSVVERTVERLQRAVAPPFESGPHVLTVSLSVGVTVFHGSSLAEADLIKHAEVAMYQAKRAGRNGMRFFDANQQNHLEQRFTLLSALRHGFPAQFALHYQPQVDGNGQMVGLEALLRWFHPTLGSVSPALFVPLAEESDFMVELGTWVLQTACRQQAAWASDPRLVPVTVAVNVSPRQFHSPDFVATVQRVLDATGAHPQQLKLEVTEGLMLHDVEDVIQKMHALRSKGVQFAIDDFGTGYSSLSYLKRLPLDQIKIDQSFVRDLRLDPNDQTIIRTIINLGHSLGLQVIAEGVETAEQLALLRSHGCDAFQGYLFDRPLAPDSAGRALRMDSVG